MHAIYSFYSFSLRKRNFHRMERSSDSNASMTTPDARLDHKGETGRPRYMSLVLSIAVASMMIAFQLLHVPVTAQTAQYGGHVTYLDQGWSADTARWWYSLTQGTAFVPYDWFLALEQASGTELFTSAGHMQRLGFLLEPPDQKYNPRGLPVGFAKVRLDVDRHRYACWRGDWVGLACASCHTGQIHYHGQQIRIEGGAAHHDLETFGRELGAALAATVSDREKLARFFRRVSASVPARSITEVQNNLSCYLQSLEEDRVFFEQAQAGSTERPVASGFGRLDAHERGVNSFLAAPLKEAKNYIPETAPVSFPALWDTPYFDWVLYNAAIRQPLTRNIIEAIGVGAPINHATIFAPTLLHNVHMENITSGQRALRELKSPRWPEAILGNIDAAKVSRGIELYDRLCVQCHQLVERTTHVPRGSSGRASGEIAIPTFDLSVIGTDPRQATTFERRKVALTKIGGPAEIASFKAAEIVTGKIVEQWMAESPENAARANEVNAGRPNEFRALLKYRARPLNGIWATAPYLHNGSVVSLYELLLPASQRKKEFYMGNWEFNPVIVGFETDSPFPGAFRFDTGITGNSNAGHEFGTDLSDSDRMALIEYLKTL